MHAAVQGAPPSRPKPPRYFMGPESSSVFDRGDNKHRGCTTNTHGNSVPEPAPALANVHNGQTTFVFSERGAYACNGDCATATNFTAWGTMLSPGSGVGEVRFSLVGTVLGLNADQTCALQSEVWTFTSRDGKDVMMATTTSDNFCFGAADPNVNHEFGHWEGDGTAGRFLGHHFSADFDETVLGSPQVASGTVTVTIS